MNELLQTYADAIGRQHIYALEQLARHLSGAKVLHINSTKAGGGVAEILHALIPIKQALGLDVRWDVIEGNPRFFQTTKSFHNGLQGNSVALSDGMLEAYEQVNAEHAEEWRQKLTDADFVFVHDPQPAALIKHFPDRKGKWIWRCHIDVRHPYRPVWKYLQKIVGAYDASIFSLPEYAQPLPNPQYLVAPSIDPLSEKNIPLDEQEIAQVFERFHLDPELPLVLQVSRFDRFKDPVGVIQAARLARTMIPLQLVLAGGGAHDDPEGEAVLNEVRAAAEGDPHVHVLMLPSDAHRTINALQRAATVIVQKSVREGFGLTVTEGLWKGKPVIGGDTGGIRLQVFDHHTGFLVRTPQGAALRLRYLLSEPVLAARMGENGHALVREHFLITRHILDYLSIMFRIHQGRADDRIELWAD